MTATMYAKDDWGELEECSEEVFPAELCSYETEILEQVAKECLPEEGDRGLEVYLDIPELEENIYSMKPTVEVWRGELWGVLEVESHNQLSERRNCFWSIMIENFISFDSLIPWKESCIF